MSPRPEIAGLSDGDQSLDYVRRVPSTVVTVNIDTGEIELIPQKAFVFNPDLSVHQEQVVVSMGSSIAAEYRFPEAGAVYVPAKQLCDRGAFLKATPRGDEPILGPAHHSIFGESLTPSKTDKAAMRDLLMAEMEWIAIPEPSAAA